MFVNAVVKKCKSGRGHFTKLYLFLRILTLIFISLWDSETTNRVYVSLYPEAETKRH
jgi:hypothetical protein